MQFIINKDIIENEIIPHLSKAKRGYVSKSDLSEIVNSIFFKLKTGTQWHLLPLDSLFTKVVLSYKTVFGKYRQWCKDNSWKNVWHNYIKVNRDKLDLSSADMDGSHTIAKKGGEDVGYQGRKKHKTTNSIFLTDRQGIPLAISTTVSGNHHDLFNIKGVMNELIDNLKSAEIKVDGLFINADSGFDSKDLRVMCIQNSIHANIDINRRNSNDTEIFIDNELYKERYSIERSNAWLDSYRSVVLRYDTTNSSWLNWNYLASLWIAIKKFTKKSR
jgi:transposase